MKRLLAVGCVIFAIVACLSPPSGAVRWEFDNDVIVDGNLTVYGNFSAPPGSFNLDNLTLNINNFPADLRPVKVTGTLPTCLDNNYPEGSVVYLTTDFKLYRCKSNGNWTTLTEATDLGGYLQSSVFSDNIITNNMIAGGIAAAKIAVDNLSAFRANMGLLTAGEIQLGYTAPSDGANPGTGVRVGDGKIESYGSGSTFGGSIIINDGTYMVTMGRQITAAGHHKKYPINNDTNFIDTGRMHFYYYANGTEWQEYVSVGMLDVFASIITLYPRMSSQTIGLYIADSNSYLSNGIIVNARKSGGLAGYFIAETATGGGITARGNDGGYFVADNGGGTGSGRAPIILAPSTSSSPPSHGAPVGSLWVTSSGVLYINTNGSTTWQKVGAQ